MYIHPPPPLLCLFLCRTRNLSITQKRKKERNISLFWERRPERKPSQSKVICYVLFHPVFCLYIWVREREKQQQQSCIYYCGYIAFNGLLEFLECMRRRKMCCRLCTYHFCLFTYIVNVLAPFSFPFCVFSRALTDDNNSFILRRCFSSTLSVRKEQSYWILKYFALRKKILH